MGVVFGACSRPVTVVAGADAAGLEAAGGLPEEQPAAARPTAMAVKGRAMDSRFIGLCLALHPYVVHHPGGVPLTFLSFMNRSPADRW